jgi:hypothetical protein
MQLPATCPTTHGEVIHSLQKEENICRKGNHGRFEYKNISLISNKILMGFLKLISALYKYHYVAGLTNVTFEFGSVALMRMQPGIYNRVRELA